MGISYKDFIKMKISDFYKLIYQVFIIFNSSFIKRIVEIRPIRLKKRTIQSNMLNWSVSARTVLTTRNIISEINIKRDFIFNYM